MVSMVRIFIMFVGFGFSVAGGISLLAYLNLLTLGYEFSYYMRFITTRVEFYLFILGVIMVIGSLAIPDRRK
ncbi:hypothetical protein A33I_14625 [Alkalihalophilus marmarensis DSM 21297]|uniref:Uncharacterized protein n=2 Tax=Alkalihalophilus TaxID=2893060 RepID=U6SPV0_9BACI|nr:hypothetical protein A33I_14625 [Alkalihalophilus marmarensis DSM 21297]